MGVRLLAAPESGYSSTVTVKRLIATIYRQLARRPAKEAQVSHEHLRESSQAQVISGNSHYDAGNPAISENPSQGPANRSLRAPHTQAADLVAPSEIGTRLISTGHRPEPAATLSGEITNWSRADQTQARPFHKGTEEALSSARIEPETGYFAAVPGEEDGDVCAVASTALARMTLVDLVNASEVSVRLVNALNRAHDQRILPFATIGAYVAAGDSAKSAMLSIRGIGRKVADELDTLIISAQAVSENHDNDFYGAFQHPPARDSAVPTTHLCAERLAELLDEVSFPEVLLGFMVPTRLRKLFKEHRNTGRLPVATLGGYLRRRQEVRAFLIKQRNCGRKSLATLDDLCSSIIEAILLDCGMTREAALAAVRGLLSEDRVDLPTLTRIELATALSNCNIPFTADDISSLSSKAINLEELSPTEFLSMALAGGLREREEHVLVRRFALDGLRRQTLEELADQYGLTRERIRQVEKSALRKCRIRANRVQFERYLATKEEEIWQLLAGNQHFLPRENLNIKARQLPGLVRLSLDVVFSGTEGWLARHARPIRAGWVRRGLSADEEAALVDAFSPRSAGGKSEWRERIEAAVDVAPWPLTLSDLASRTGGIPEGIIADFLAEHYGALIEDGVVTQVERLRAAERLIFVLRDAGGALHTSQIRARHHKLFSLDVSEQAIGSTLGRLTDALIVDRGTYDLYENLGLPSEKITAIRDQVYAYIDSKGRFISAKVIHADLFSSLTGESGLSLSPYLILGLVQDDERFVVKRGLMVGLQHFDPEETFVSLEETIHNLVAEYGPITVPEIVERMAEERQVLDAGIAPILKASQEIVAVGKGRHDIAVRAFGSEAAIRRLELAAELSLLDGKLSLHGLLARLRAVGVATNSNVVNSWIRKVPRFAVEEGIFALAQPSPIVERYERAFSEVYEPSHGPAVNRQRLAEALRGSDAQELIELDYRTTDASGKNLALERQGGDAEIIHDLLSEFEF